MLRTKVRAAGGQVVASYDSIGVVVARSGNSGFASAVEADARVEGAEATSRFATSVDGAGAAGKDQQQPAELPNSAAADADSLSPLQWDMRQIHTPEAHAITGGSRAVLVGDIDTGIDFTHPDLAPNIDVANSANCVSGAPVPGPAAQDDNGHGTHTAGTIAAAANGIGIVGVAPNVRIAGIKAGNADGFFFPEAVVCAFMWAGTHGMDVTNNSYFADPWLFNCKNDPEQRAIWKAEQRAIKFAQQQRRHRRLVGGERERRHVAPDSDDTSPDDTTPGQSREVTNACVVIPVEVPGVIGVSATGSCAPGHGRRAVPGLPEVVLLELRHQRRPTSLPRVATLSSGRRRSTAVERPCALDVAGRSGRQLPGVAQGHSTPASPGAVYCYQQGTSMAAPHAAGVAALIISRYGDTQGPQNGTMRPGKVRRSCSRPPTRKRARRRLPPGYSSILGSPERQAADLPRRAGPQLLVRRRTGGRSQRDHACLRQQLTPPRKRIGLDAAMSTPRRPAASGITDGEPTKVQHRRQG